MHAVPHFQSFLFFLFIPFFSILLPTAFAETINLRGRVALFSSHPEFITQDWSLGGAPVSRVHVRSGDFNGDGCSDLLTDAESQVIAVSLSNCSTGFNSPKLIPISPEVPINSVLVGNIDNDQCSDLVITGKDRLLWLRSLCDGNFKPQAPQHLDFPLTNPTLAHWPRPTHGVIFSGGSLDSKLTSLRMWPPNSNGQTVSFPLPVGESFLGAADVTGDGIQEVITWTTHYREFVASDGALANPALSTKPWRATFSVNHLPVESFFEDFNGDGRDDILSLSDGVGGWWLAQSNGVTGLESSVQLKFSGSSSRSFLVAGDFDGNGYADLLSCPKQGSSQCTRAFLYPGEGVHGIQINVEDGPSTTTSHDGSFSLSLERHRNLVLLASGAGYHLSSNGKRTILNRNPNTRVNFLAVSDKLLSDGSGRILSLVPVPSGPKICLGVFPEAERASAKWGPQMTSCPSGHAWMATDDSFSTSEKKGEEFSRGSCCPLPADDILVPEIHKVQFHCPDESVVVGAIPSKTSGCTNCRDTLLCQKINTERYQLGPEQGGVYYGVGASSRLIQSRISSAEIPAAIRTGISLVAFGRNDPDGCIGVPAGSLFVGSKPGKDCSSHRFRQLQYRGREGDPRQGEPVTMFPPCPEGLSSPLQATSSCTRRQTNSDKVPSAQ